MEEWNAGILGIKAEIYYFNCKKLFSFNFVQDKLTHHSITPSFLPSLPRRSGRSYWGETFFYFTGAIIPIGAKPLSSASRVRCVECVIKNITQRRASTMAGMKQRT